VALTMVAICVWSTTVAATVPIVAQRVGIDPAVLSAPLITTLVDTTGLVIYFTVAKTILGI
ncbi:MAG TPA: magnesium transporter, partial [Vicinamibacteria bacterium]